MFALLHSLTMFVIDFFKSPRRLEAENMFLRHQLSIALRRAPPRLRLARSSAHFASDLVEWTDMRHSDGYANLRLRRPA